MIRKRLRKIIRHLPLIFCIPKKNKYVQVISQKVIRIVEKKISINDSKRRKSRMALSYSKKNGLYH